MLVPVPVVEGRVVEPVVEVPVVEVPVVVLNEGHSGAKSVRVVLRTND